MIGLGVSNYLDSRRLQRESLLIQEEERLRRNAQLMDAYGDKDSLEDIQRALEHYKVRTAVILFAFFVLTLCYF